MIGMVSFWRLGAEVTGAFSIGWIAMAIILFYW